MTADRWARQQEIFHHACELPEEERRAYVESACGEDGELRREVLALLAADGESAVLAAPIGALAEEMAAGEPAPGDTVGPYRVVRELGRGGMGTVYLAERADGSFEQRVALKLVSGVVATPGAVDRFLAERRILARLAHPNIARLLDGGASATGSPYLVMEHVEGEPLDVYCDRHRLPVQRRLELFLTVCEAVQHAHRNLVVHRDLKPSNVLVDAEGTPKLLDFGISKLLDPGAAAAGLTHRGELPMTPEYASPEQVRGEPVSVSSDVYALGLLLFELLTGRRAQAVTSRRRDDIERAVCATPTVRPSTAVGRGDGATATEVAASRGTTPDRLRRRLRGDLDAIVLTALRKEPELRYRSVEQMAADLRRHLRALPVAARAAGPAYRLRRFARRHAVALTAAAGVVVLVALLVAFYTVRLHDERDRARAEAAKAEQVADFLAGVFRLSDPRSAAGDEVTVRTALDRGAERIEEELAGQPVVQAELMNVLGRTYLELGDFATARKLLDQALALRRRHLGDDHPDVAETLRNLGLLWYLQGDYPHAEERYLQAVAALERSRGPRALELAAVLNNLGNLYKRTGEYERGVAVFERALAIRQQHLGPDAVDVAKVLNNFGALLYVMGEDERARGLYERALDIYERELGPDHPMVAGTLGNLALVRQRLGMTDGLEPLLRRVVEIERKAYGPTHLKVGTALNALGRHLAASGETRRAAEAFEESARVYRQALRPDHPYVAYPLLGLGRLHLAAGRPAEALPYFRQAADIRRRELGPEHPLLAPCLEGVGEALTALGDPGAAAEPLRRAAEIRRRAGAQ